MAESTTNVGVDQYGHSIVIGQFHVERQTHDNFVLILNLNEICKIVSTCGGRRREATPKIGAISILPPGEKYTENIAGVSSSLFFVLPWSRLAGWIGSETSFRPGGIQLEPRLCLEDDELARRLLCLMAGAPDERGAALHWAIERIVHAHSNRAKVDPKRLASGGLTSRQLKRVTDAVKDRLGSDPTLDDMANEVGLSKFHFIRAFKSTVGTTPHRYVQDRKLERALEALLDCDADISDVATRMGFSHGSHLSRMLKRRFGVTPEDFRRSVLPQTTYGIDHSA